MNDSLYEMIFKRKSFHLFRNIGNLRISRDELAQIKEVWQTLTPLCPGIKTAMKIVPAEETTCKRGQEYCILLYSEKKGNFLQNIGYLGEQLDLSLAERNIGTLWFGIGEPDERTLDGLNFVIMIAIAKVDDPAKFRKDLFQAKRKPVEEIWQGGQIDGVTDIVRFAPSACNTQPWLVAHEGNALTVYRYKKPGKRGMMPAGKVSYYNQIDVGIFLCFLDLCLQHCNIAYEKELFTDNGEDTERTRIANYKGVME